MHLRSIALALAVLPLLALPVRAQDGPAPQNSSRTDLFIGFGGQNRLGNEDAGWRSAIPLSVDVNVTDRVALVVMPALGVGVSTSTGSWVDYAFQAGPRFRFGGQQRVTPFAQILAGVQHGTVVPANGVVVITTKRGRAGPARWNYHVEGGQNRDDSPYRLTYGLIGYTPSNPLQSQRRCRLFEIYNLDTLQNKVVPQCTLVSAHSVDVARNDSTTWLVPAPRTAMGGSVSGGNTDLRYFISGDGTLEYGPYGLPTVDRHRYDSLQFQVRPEMERPSRIKQYSFRSNVNATMSPQFDAALSAGLTLLLDVPAWGQYRLLGQTRDDAAGEAFDKVATLLGLGYPGGPAIERLAREGDPRRFTFPRPMIGEGFEFSFSGLKTAVARWVEARERAGEPVPLHHVAASFQEAVCDVLTGKAIDAAATHGIDHLLIGGGVAANSRLRSMAEERAAARGILVRVPRPGLCTDNGAMVAALGSEMVTRGRTPSALDLPADSSLPVTSVLA